jgi:hypothetical protein
VEEKSMATIRAPTVAAEAAEAAEVAMEAAEAAEVAWTWTAREAAWTARAASCCTDQSKEDVNNIIVKVLNGKS